MLVTDVIKAYKNMVIGVINEQPVAYDKEAVVEQLEEKQKKWKTQLQEQDTNFIDRQILKQHIKHFDKAIELVKAGGIDG